MDVLEVLQHLGRVHVVSRRGLANARAAERGGQPPHTIRETKTTRLGTVLARATSLTPVLSWRDLLALRDRLAAADIVDVQWEDNAVFLPLIRVLNRRAQTVVTLHDVLSQRFGRQRDQQTRPSRRAVWAARRLAATALEQVIVHQADDVVVLSTKDADLLPRRGRRARVHVVPPAIQGPLRPARTPARAGEPPLLLFVGFMARWENEDAVQWFITDILPTVRRAVPDVRVAVAGGGLREPLAAELRAAQVEVHGFIDDLEPLYAEAEAVIVPLRYGAGVKFKVVDALVRGVPVVTTTVGNEGITPDDAAVVADDAAGFAAAVVRVLSDPSAAEAHARSRVAAVAGEFGVARFRARLEEVYR